MKTKTTKDMNPQLIESIEVYGEGLREVLEDMGIPKKYWDDVWSLDNEEVEQDPEAQWLIGWFMGVAESSKTLPDNLVKLYQKKAKARGKSTKTPVKKTTKKAA
jgi:hypothetical protein